MRIGVIGARLAGSYAGILLAGMGHDVLLFDDPVGGEKPCGGGVTAKALRNMPWFRAHPLPHNRIERVCLTSSDGSSSEIPLKDPLFIYSRATLDTSLRQAAIGAGARFVPERALAFTQPRGKRWLVETAGSEYEVDLLVGADGARSSVRAAVLGKYQSADLSLALGYYLPGQYHPDSVVACFQEDGFQGYLWSFPRVDHCSVGILRWLPVTNAAELRARVQRFIEIHYPESNGDRRFYAARIPCLRRDTLLRQRVCGPDWALLGDAAGFADAITAEGIYFALRSAELLAQSVRQGSAELYERSWRTDFGRDLLKAAEWRDRFYGGTFLFQAFTRRAVQLIGCSTTIRSWTDRLISGYCGYRALRRQLILRSPRILIEALLHKLGNERQSVRTPAVEEK
jgi:flavin-dependent dehydrogenase